MSPVLPKWRPRRTLIDLYNEKDHTAWYWRAAATLAAFLIMIGFLIFPSAFKSLDKSVTTSAKSSAIAAVILLVLGYVLSLVIALICSSWVFQLDILFVPCLSSCLLGLINVLCRISTHGPSSPWTSSSVAAVIVSVTSTLVYTIAALLTFRKIHIVRARDAMHRHQPDSSADGTMPETELQRQQLLRLLLQQEDARKISPDNNQQTFKLEWPGNSDNRRNTMTTLRNLPRAARQAYESRSSASFMVQDPHPNAAMHMDPVTEEESLDPRIASLRQTAYAPTNGYDEHIIPGIVNTRFPSPPEAQTPATALPQLQANGYPIEKPEAHNLNESHSVERNLNQYHVVEEDEWRRQREEEQKSVGRASRESRRMEIELTDRGRGGVHEGKKRQDMEGVEVIGSIRRVETDGWGRRLQM